MIIKNVKPKINKFLKFKRQLLFVAFIKFVIVLIEVFFIILSNYAVLDNKKALNIFPQRFTDIMISTKYSNEHAFCIICFMLLLFISAVNIPVTYGIWRWVGYIKEDKLPKYTDIFYYYTMPRLFLKSLFFKVALLFRIIFSVLLLVIPASVTFAFFCIKMQTANESEKFLLSFAVLVSLIFMLCGVILFVRRFLKCICIPFFQVINNSKASCIKSALSRKINP